MPDLPPPHEPIWMQTSFGSMADDEPPPDFDVYQTFDMPPPPTEVDLSPPLGMPPSPDFHLVVAASKQTPGTYQVLGLRTNYQPDGLPPTVSAISIAKDMAEPQAAHFAAQVAGDYHADTGFSGGFDRWLGQHTPDLQTANPDLTVEENAPWKVLPESAAQKALTTASEQPYRLTPPAETVQPDLTHSATAPDETILLAVEGIYDNDFQRIGYRSVAYAVEETDSDPKVGRILNLDESDDFETAFWISEDLAETIQHELVPPDEQADFLEQTTPQAIWEPMTADQLAWYDTLQRTPYLYEPPRHHLPDSPYPPPDHGNDFLTNLSITDALDDHVSTLEQERIWAETCDLVAVDHDLTDLPDIDRQAMVEHALGGLGMDSTALTSTATTPDLIDSRTGTIGWVGIYQPDVDDPSLAYPGILMLLPQDDQGYEAAFAPLAQSDLTTAQQQAEDILQQAHQQPFDTFMQDMISQVEREGIIFQPDTLTEIAPEIFEPDDIEIGSL